MIGTPEAIGKQLSGQLADAMRKSRIAVGQAGDKTDFTLRGYVVASKEKTGTKVSYIWDVTDAAGKRVNRITGEETVAGGAGKDPWSGVTAQTTQTIAERTASTLAAWLPTQGEQPAVAQNTTPPSAAGGPVQSAAATPATAARTQVASAGPTTGSIGGGDVAAIVPSVSGAPGDGSTSLTSALQRELARNGVSLAEKPGQAYRVEGKVAVGQSKDGKQPVQIDWLVKDPQGKRLGTVSQKNEIPEGSLNGAWGQTADAAAAAAAQGILKLLPNGGGKTSTN